MLAGHHSLGSTRWRGKKKAAQLRTGIKDAGLKGSVIFYDTQMDEANLGNWTRDKSIALGTEIFEDEMVERSQPDGESKP
jgi:glycerol-3-phosphate dehydrogenase